MDKKPIKGVAYIRYSSHAQDEVNSVAAQTTTIGEYAEKHGIEIENYYIDMAKTGRNTKRPEYQRMKSDIENGNVEAKIILVRALDRLHRNSKNQLTDIDWLIKNNIRLISITDGVDTDKETSKLLITVRAAVAEEYSDTLSRNTRAGCLELAKQCKHLGGSAPLGYMVNAEGFYEIDELKAPIIRDIYKLYLQDMGYTYIMKYLKDKGYKTSEGNDFSKTSLNAILRNPKYMGTYVYDRSAPKDSEGKRNSHAVKNDYIRIKEGMPAIISEEEYWKVQHKMDGHKKQYQNRASKNYYALNGITHCAKCGKAFSGSSCGSHGKKYYNYKGNCTCGIKNVKVEQLNKFTFYALQQCIFNDDNKAAIIAKINEKLSLQNALQSSEINVLKNQINGLKNAQDNLTNYLGAGKGTQTILDKIQKNETEMKVLQAQLEAKSKEIGTVDEETYERLVKQFLNYMCTEKSPEAHELREATISDVQIDENDVTIHFQKGVTADEATICYFNDNKED